MLKKYPFYLKATLVLFGLSLFFLALSMLRTVLVPVSFGLMLAILLNPVVNWLQSKKVNKVAAISLAIFISLLFIGLVTYLIATQIASFSEQLPAFQKKGLELVHKLQDEVAQRFNVDVAKQDKWLNDAGNSMKSVVGQTFGAAASVLEILLLIPLYAFLFLYYKTLILNFLYEVFAEENAKEVNVVLTQTKAAIQQYMVGLLIEAVIVATLNSVALVILGVKYAILLGAIGALLNVLPFIGGIIAVLLPLMIATVTKDGFGTQIGIVIAYLVIQFIDNHFLVPYIVSSKVKINALASIIIVLLGGLIWGIGGMFLSIPFIGTLKIIFDRVPELKPWGKLIGDEVPTRHKGEIWTLRRRKRTAK
jgi:predicted PurR-regulated permease PerM